ncbi:MAG TPA: hypothetical protein VMV44_15185 [Rectinemataceae bacterium]|nr:hypothetical protein [Rectinemataceae bacterium]
MLLPSKPGLGKLDLPFKLALTTFFLVAGVGYLLGLANIWLTYTPVDTKPGLSIADIRIAFNGAPTGSKLEKALKGTMNQYIPTEADGKALFAWIEAGGKQSDFSSVQQTFQTSCDTCHSKDVATAGIVTDSYDSLKPLLATDTGISWSQLVQNSHTHVNGLISVMFVLGLAFSFTAFSRWLKGGVIILGFLSILMDVGSWWLAKMVGAFAPLVIVGGASLGLAFGLMIVLGLWDLWIKRAE